ncbi:unnamed protein product [Coffea canephora]|uniref:Glycoside hydrolase family 19 catalytic domain-containing protein n=1 Tax=Coffea canephora TaxID=49390 RepID=A0A068U0I4_COFCA|nr:unnamed protein product [Coffea canephora]
MLKYHNDPRCSSIGFYTYTAFITAAKSFNGFGTTGDVATRKREIAAFLGQTSHETIGGWLSTPDGPYAWGYCFIKEIGTSGSFCDSPDWPCPAGRRYCSKFTMTGRDNFNYGKAGRAIGVDIS